MPPPSPFAAAASPGDPDRPLQGVRVLVADDDPVNTLIVRAALQHAGADARFVTDGRHCVAAVRHTPFDVVLMDMVMPDLDGPSAARAIRALGRAVHQPAIVAVTGNDRPEDRVRCADAGMDGFLSKPFHERRLWDAVTAALAAHDGASRQR